MSGLACERCPVRDRAACSVLTADERAALARSGRTRHLTRGELLFAAGDQDVACATLIRGALKIVAHSEDGTERILALVHPAGFTGELFAPFAHHDVVALTDSELCVFPRTDMTRAIGQHPKLATALLRRADEALHELRWLIELGARRHAADKVGALILSLAHAASDSPCHPASRFELPLSRGEMAGLLGLTIETVSRALTRFEREGAIRRNGARGIELLAPARLAPAGPARPAA